MASEIRSKAQLDRLIAECIAEHDELGIAIAEAVLEAIKRKTPEISS